MIYLDIEPEKAKERGGYGEEVYEKVELQERVRRWFLTAMMHSGSFAGGDVMMRVDAGDSLEKVEEEVWDCVVECERMFKKEKLGEVGPWRISDELLEMTFNRPVEEILK